MMETQKEQSLTIRFTLNGKPQTLEVTATLSALSMLRDKLKLKGTKEGCCIGECGACTILVDDLPMRACLMLAPQANGHEIVTVEGLASYDERMHPLQEAFREAHGLQCGFCTPGILMTLKAFLDENPAPSETEIREALSGNLCRCTGYQHIVEAVKLAAARMGGGQD